METAGSSLKEAGAKRVILLNVSGPFHSPMMETAGQQLARVLENVRLESTGHSLCIECDCGFCGRKQERLRIF